MVVNLFFNRGLGLDVGYTLTLTNGVSLKRALGRNAYRHELIRRVVNTTSTGCTNTLVYAYDDAGRRTARNADSFGYNARSEVTAATTLSNAYTYAYDFIGSHTTSTVNSATTTYTANALNQYTAILSAPAPLREPTYDLDGSAPSEARRFLRGASPRRVRTSHPLVPSVGTMEEESNPNEVV